VIGSILPVGRSEVNGDWLQPANDDSAANLQKDYENSSALDFRNPTGW